MDAPAIAVNRDGKQFAVAWMDMRTGRTDRQVYWVFMDGVMKEKPLASNPEGLKGHPSIVLDGMGALYATWEDGRFGVQRIYYRTAEGKDRAISPEKGKACYPSLACGKVVGVAYEFGGDAVFTVAPK
jgi:hypothetical protein